MSEQTPRESLSEALSRVFEMGTLPNFLREADALLADPDFCRWLASVKADAYRMGYNKATADIVDEGRSLKAKANAWDEGRDCSGPYPVNPYRGEQA